MRDQRRRAMTASVASSLLILSLGLVPTIDAADHLDGPGVANNGAADITDLYAFPSPERPGHLVLQLPRQVIREPAESLGLELLPAK